MTCVELRNLRKAFGGMVAVQDLNLTIEDGQFVTLLGPSGCGKSTTLGCIAGLEDPTDGEILFDNVVVNDMTPRNRDIAMVFQDYALYPHMSVYDNLAFGLELRKTRKPEIQMSVRRVAEFLGLASLLDRKPGQLSGGQRQRVALGRAIVRNPSVFLMDEPLSNLDAALRVSTRTEIKKLQQELGTTTIFVTHDQEEAMVLSDRIAIMQGGILQQFAAPTQVYADPVNIFVAGFIGSPKMNLIVGALHATDAGLEFASSDGTVVYPAEGNPEHMTSGVTLGIRPEHVRLDRRAEGAMTGIISLVEPVGAVTYVNVALAPDIVIKVSTDPSDEYLDGERVTVTFVASRVLFFDVESGERLRLR